jgi:hypothetical protein
MKNKYTINFTIKIGKLSNGETLIAWHGKTEDPEYIDKLMLVNSAIIFESDGEVGLSPYFPLGSVEDSVWVEDNYLSAITDVTDMYKEMFGRYCENSALENIAMQREYDAESFMRSMKAIFQSAPHSLCPLKDTIH